MKEKKIIWVLTLLMFLFSNILTPISNIVHAEYSNPAIVKDNNEGTITITARNWTFTIKSEDEWEFHWWAKTEDWPWTTEENSWKEWNENSPCWEWYHVPNYYEWAQLIRAFCDINQQCKASDINWSLWNIDYIYMNTESFKEAFNLININSWYWTNDITNGYKSYMIKYRYGEEIFFDDRNDDVKKFVRCFKNPESTEENSVKKIISLYDATSSRWSDAIYTDRFVVDAGDTITRELVVQNIESIKDNYHINLLHYKDWEEWETYNSYANFPFENWMSVNKNIDLYYETVREPYWEHENWTIRQNDDWSISIYSSGYDKEITIAWEDETTHGFWYGWTSDDPVDPNNYLHSWWEYTNYIDWTREWGNNNEKNAWWWEWDYEENNYWAQREWFWVKWPCQEWYHVPSKYEWEELIKLYCDVNEYCDPENDISYEDWYLNLYHQWASVYFRTAFRIWEESTLLDFEKWLIWDNGFVRNPLTYWSSTPSEYEEYKEVYWFSIWNPYVIRDESSSDSNNQLWIATSLKTVDVYGNYDSQNWSIHNRVRCFKDNDITLNFKDITNNEIISWGTVQSWEMITTEMLPDEIAGYTNKYYDSDNEPIEDILQVVINQSIDILVERVPITYKVMFFEDDESQIAEYSQDLTYDELEDKYLDLNHYTKNYKSFYWWKRITEEGEIIYNDGAEITENLTWISWAVINLYAQWTPNLLTISFNGNWSTDGSMENQEIRYEDLPLFLNSLWYSKLGYQFVQWVQTLDNSETRTFSNGQNIWNLIEEIINESKTITLTAEWSRDEDYTIQYDYNWWKIIWTNPASYNVDTENFTIINPSKPWYNFTYWEENWVNIWEDITINQWSVWNRSFKAIFTPRDDTEYKVEHRLETINWDYDLDEREDKNWRTWDPVEFEVRDETVYPWFEYVEIPEVVNIDWNWDTVVKIYYSRKLYNLTIINEDNENTESIKFGTSITLNPWTKVGFSFWWWQGIENLDNNEWIYTMPVAEDGITLTAIWNVVKSTPTAWGGSWRSVSTNTKTNEDKEHSSAEVKDEEKITEELTWDNKELWEEEKIEEDEKNDGKEVKENWWDNDFENSTENVPFNHEKAVEEKSENPLTRWEIAVMTNILLEVYPQILDWKQEVNTACEEYSDEQDFTSNEKRAITKLCRHAIMWINDDNNSPLEEFMVGENTTEEDFARVINRVISNYDKTSLETVKWALIKLEDSQENVVFETVYNIFMMIKNLIN